MTKPIIFLLALFCVSMPNYQIENDSPILVTKIEGNNTKKAVMFRMVNGPVELYYQSMEVIEYEHTKEHGFIAVESPSIDIIYIGINKQVEQINAGNYERLIKKYFPEAYKLHQQINHPTFQLETLPSLLSAHYESL